MNHNWLKATTTTTGTGTITLSSVSGRPIPSAICATGEFVGYSIATSDGKFESGLGKIAATNTLERTKVVSTYNGTTYDSLTASALTLASGTHDVYITALAENTQHACGFTITSGMTNPHISSAHMGGSQSNLQTAAVQRNTAIPFKLEYSGILTAMGANVSVSQASSTFLLGVYEVDSDGRPGRLLAKTSATLSSATTGYKTQAVGTSVRLNPGWYYSAICVTSSGSNPSFTGCIVNHAPMGSSGLSQLNAYRSDSVVTDLADPFPTTSPVYGAGSSAITTTWIMS